MIARRKFLVTAAALAAAFLPRPVRAALPKPAALSPEDQADVARMVGYLNDIRTMQSHFQQIAADGSSASGILYVERPGKLRLEYDPPATIMILADGRGIYYWDSKLEQLSQTLVEDTPAWFLLRPNITASDDVTVTRFERGPGILRMTMIESANPDLGSVTLTMSDKPLELRQWTVIDAQARPVTVTLTDPRYGLPIEEKMFNWIDPRTGLHRLPQR